MPLMPKRVKYRKQQRGRAKGMATRGNFVVFGDYGVGPNHVLPTGGTARARGGLSVMDFLRVRTWIGADSDLDPDLIEDVAWFARQEGLEAHARAAEIRRGES